MRAAGCIHATGANEAREKTVKVQNLWSFDKYYFNNSEMVIATVKRKTVQNLTVPAKSSTVTILTRQNRHKIESMILKFRPDQTNKKT